MIRFPEDERNSIADLENLMIKTSLGSMIPVKQIARLDIRDGLSTIQRKNRKRAINVTADIDLTITTGNEVIESVLKTVMPKITQKFWFERSIFERI